MNTETGQVYWNERDVMTAEARGEPLMPLTKVGGSPDRAYEKWCYDAKGNLLPRSERRRREKQRRKVSV